MPSSRFGHCGFHRTGSHWIFWKKPTITQYLNRTWFEWWRLYLVVPRGTKTP